VDIGRSLSRQRAIRLHAHALGHNIVVKYEGHHPRCPCWRIRPRRAAAAAALVISLGISNSATMTRRCACGHQVRRPTGHGVPPLGQRRAAVTGCVPHHLR
jgi:hypothetical protein